MKDKEIIERFEKWQSETGKYPGLDLSKVEYEEKKFKSVLSSPLKSGGTPSTKIKEYWGSKDGKVDYNNFYPWRNIEKSLFEKKYLYDYSDIITKIGLEKSSTWLVPKNSILIAIASASKGLVTITKIPLCTNQNILAAACKKEYSVEYIYYNLLNIYKEISGKSDFGNLTKASEQERIILLPKDYNDEFDSLTIQRAIAEFIEYYSNDKSYKLEVVHQIKDRYDQIELGVIPWTLAQTDTLNERFNSFCNENGLELNMNEINFKEDILDNVSHIIPGQSPTGDKLNKNELGIPFHQGKTLYGKKYILPAKVWTEHPKKLAKENDILVSMRAPAGALNVASYDLAIGRGLSAVRPKENVSLNYLYFVLKSNELKIKSSGDKGGIFSSITKGQLQELKVLIPVATKEHTSLHIQEVIANFLSTYFNKFNEVDDAITRLNFALPNITRVFIKKVFLGMKNQES